jgi:hypothetical protein
MDTICGRLCDRARADEPADVSAALGAASVRRVACGSAGPHAPVSVSAYYYIRVRILLSLRVGRSACSYIRVRILLYTCPHTAKRAGRQVRMLLYPCPHTTIYVSAYC